MLGTQERPVISGVSKRLAALCKQRGERAPSRSSIYNAVDRAEPPSYSVADLPPAVQRTLHNLDVAVIGGGQLVFHAFNYGSWEACSFASGLPWLCLLKASQRPGFRPKSLALLRAVMAYRGI
jgi:hypothetical protein